MDLPKTPLVDGGSSTSTYVPRGVQDGVPKIGMSFESVKDVEVFYNAYAKEVDFSVRKGSECKKSLTKELYSKLFVCSKEGKPNNGKGILDPVKKRRRGVVRENCEAALRVSKNKDEKWVVVKFIEEHSHILATPRKLPEKLGARGGRQIMDQLLNCIYNSPSPIDFEVNWKCILSHNNLQDHEWLGDMFVIREKLIPIYSKHIFMANMRTTQRSEGMNSFLDKYVNRKTTFSDFVLRFERVLKRLRQHETEADHEMNYSKPLLKTNFDVEKQMVDIYTKFIFYKFQADVVESVKYGALPLREERPFRIHEVYKCVQPDSIYDVTREVNYDFDKKMANCTCMMFELEGVPCRHILLVLRNEKVCLLPESLILKRWTRTITRESVFYENTVELRPNLDEVVHIRRNDLASKIHKVLDVAFKSEEALSFLEKKIDVICDKIGQFEPDCGTKMRMPQEIHVHPPDIVKQKVVGKD
ncbi:hypothetical protein H6P81_016076 [Aristolochia fimbriata]|uniref:SWIM-type domain-containing protein n=1 Tax=Aristolochia fimbriata TaxID=158543 RepID=A0AAV7EAC6_ARIFI|nr:hypothetical protein H6P81_016076 [Aristolochia fimbriata]